MAMAGPAGGRPCIRTPDTLPCWIRFNTTSSTCALKMEGTWEYSPAAAVPVRTNIPEPMMAPIPSAVSDHGPNDLGSLWPGRSESAISLSMDFLAKSWLARRPPSIR